MANQNQEVDCPCGLLKGERKSNMQAALEITAKYCHNEMEEYGKCVSSKPGTWHHDCHTLKVKVAQCTSSQ
ncbi:hypothetical protein GDO86_011940 [Hymenochirus boettgeri]|uniref:IMS import disulfide relay-system CHCH-CHCH-like Cx9C domain-containing protein n=1 Tax=Hymenochirus boettgeri TaxID=247094 RepID=A0A8T2JDH0_9PIPI|nr:hypothetical protein GDO86_011940 [Hymenochirus boettgeri]